MQWCDNEGWQAWIRQKILNMPEVFTVSELLMGGGVSWILVVFLIKAFIQTHCETNKHRGITHNSQEQKVSQKQTNHIQRARMKHKTWKFTRGNCLCAHFYKCFHLTWSNTDEDHCSLVHSCKGELWVAIDPVLWLLQCGLMATRCQYLPVYFVKNTIVSNDLYSSLLFVVLVKSGCHHNVYKPPQIQK